MSDQQVAQDIQRVKQRIGRLRGRMGKHWQEVEKLPAQSASQAWHSLGEMALGIRSGEGSQGKHWLLGLLAAGAAWYLSQPGAAGRLWRLVYPSVKAWSQQPEQPEVPPTPEA